MERFEQITTGDYVFVHMRDDLAVESDGPTMRAGVVTRIGADFFDEPMIALDDGYPPLYLAHTRAISNHGRTGAPV